MNRLLFLLLLLVGCTPAAITPAPTSEPVTLWGRIYPIAQAPQSDAPVMWSDHEQTVMAWFQMEGDTPRIMLRSLKDGQLSPVSLLSMPLRTPDRLKIVPGVASTTHLFWIDTKGDGETRVFSAFVNADLQLERGMIEIADIRAEDFDIHLNPDGSLWLVWSGGHSSERSLYASRIDPIGRPREAQSLIDNADHPVFVGDRLYWIQESGVYRARFDGGILWDVTPLVLNVPLHPGDWLLNFAIATDTTHTYWFWNVLRADGTVQTWFSAGDTPQLLAVGAPSTALIQTGFNSGSVFATGQGNQAVKWAVPLSGQFETLPVAAQVGNALHVLYFKAGQVVASQPITALKTNLAGFPALTTNRDRHLFLAWSLPVSTEYAELLLTTTEP